MNVNETVESTTIGYCRIIKQFWDEKEKDWIDKKFVKVWNSSSHLRQIDVSWFVRHYGNAVYGQTWWTTIDSIVMEERIYTHWALTH